MVLKVRLIAGVFSTRAREASRCITTFSTHVGLRRYKRLNYGTNAAAEIFPLQQQLQGLTGVTNVADDIIVYGRRARKTI